VPGPQFNSAPRFLDRDLYCLKCGYNLRGLSGDPVRCPECGYDNPIADVEIPADLIAAQLKKMEPGVAVTIARTEIRKRLARGPGKWTLSG
jgi:hypothetical protein